MKLCNCGSGEHSWWIERPYYGGLYVARVCSKCEEEKLSKYRLEVNEQPATPLSTRT